LLLLLSSPRSAPEDEQRPLWPPLLLPLGVLFIATETRNPALALTALIVLVLLPKAWRLMTRRWGRGEVLRGLGAGYLASHPPLPLGAFSTLNRPERRIHPRTHATVETDSRLQRQTRISCLPGSGSVSVSRSQSLSSGSLYAS
jgi:hypothetical protein